MNRGQRRGNRNVTINEEDEEEKIKKTDSKKAIIRAEFEKHKKELKLHVSDASKMNEIKLKNQLEELLTANNRKRDNKRRLEEYENNLERENLEATMFYQTVNRGNTTRFENSGYLTVGFHPNRTTSDIFGMGENGTAEALSTKKLELQETLANIELLTEQEGEILGSLEERYEEAKKNKFLLSRRRNDLQRMNEHADIRFFDLKRIDFLARNKEAATTSHLKELRDNINELQKQESTFKKQKDEDHERETKYIINKQNEMAGILIELDQKRLELQAKQEMLRKLELHFEEMKDKRKTTKIVTQYIQTFAALEEPKVNLATAHLALKELLERQDSSKSFEYARRGSPTAQDKNPSLNSSMKDSRYSRLDEDTASPVKKSSFAERNFYIDQIQNFYENHPEGPHQHVNKLIEQYDEFSFREQSLKSNYEELQDFKGKKQNELKTLKAELANIKSKNHYITLGRTGSKIIESNEQEAIDSGMLKVKREATTINQAKFEYENQRDADNFVTLYTTTESFVLRCYLDSVEMMSRLSKVLSAIYSQSEHSSGGGFMSDEVRDIAKRIKNHINSIKKIKRGKQDPHSHSMLDNNNANPELQRTHTNNTSSSDKEQDTPGVLDLNEVYEMFVSMFEGFEDRASEFISKLKSDVMILSFINIDEIRAYLLNFQSDLFIVRDMPRIIQEVESMRDQAIENMVQKFDTIFRLYSEFCSSTHQAIDETGDYLRARGIVSQGSQKNLHSRNNSETNGFVKGALEKKWTSLKSKYEYDPTRDYRRETQNIESGEQNPTPRPKLAGDEADDANKANWDSEDLRAKISEIVSTRAQKARADFLINGQKPVFRGKNEEEQKRLQMKKEKEKQKQAIENMTDEDFLDYQRKQIKEVKEENVIEVNESELFRKAQADQVSRLSQKVPIEELKRMIDNSKVLSKIQILERKKGATDGKKDFKQNTVENYIPPEPLKFPKSSIHISTSESKFRIERNAWTPNVKQTQSRVFNLTDRNTESDFEDSPKDVSWKGSSFKSASRFKPREREMNTEATVDSNQKPQTAGSKRVMTFESFKSKQKYNDTERDAHGGNRMPFLSETTSPTVVTVEDFVKKNKLLINTGKKPYIDRNEPLSAKHKSATGLPKLETQSKKKKKDGQSKKKRKHHHSQKIGGGGDGDNLNTLLNLQTDPLLKMVYSPSFFTTSFPTSTIGGELDYKFDAYKFQAPSLLIGEKL